MSNPLNDSVVVTNINTFASKPRLQSLCSTPVVSAYTESRQYTSLQSLCLTTVVSAYTKSRQYTCRFCLRLKWRQGYSLYIYLKLMWRQGCSKLQTVTYAAGPISSLWRQYLHFAARCCFESPTITLLIRNFYVYLNSCLYMYVYLYTKLQVKVSASH